MRIRTGLALTPLALTPMQLVLQGGGAPPEITPEELELLRMIYNPVTMLIGLAALAVGVWMVIDAWNNYGAGCGLISCVGCAFGSWIAIIVYLIVRFAAYPPDRTQATGESTSFAPGPLPPRSAPSASRVDIDLAPEERDPQLDELITEGRLRDAMGRAQDLLKMAKDFRDQRGIQRYSKYVERIRRGMS